MAIQQIGNNLTTPRNFPDFTTSGKIQLLWDVNHEALYSRLSPYSNSGRGILSWGNQPFVWTAIGDKSFPNTRYDSRAFGIGSSLKDVIRTSKFLVSGMGIQFLGKQFLLQTGNPYNERRIYNPLSPIVAAGRGATLGIIGRPERSFDTSGGLLGIARTLIGSGITDTLFGPSDVAKPFGTAPDALIGGPLVNTGGKGLLRAGTANTAKAHLEAAWIPVGKQNFSFGSIVKNVFKSVFANFMPAVQSGIKQRSDEGAYGLMVGAGNSKFGYEGNSGPFGFGQVWLAGDKIMRREKQYTTKAYRLFTNYDSKGMRISKLHYSEGGLIQTEIPTMGYVGYKINESKIEKKPGYRYEDAVGEMAKVPQNNEYGDSEMMVQYAYYADPKQQFPTKDQDTNIKNARTLKKTLSKVLENISDVSDNLYSVNVPIDAQVIRSGKADKYGYDRLFNTSQKGVAAFRYDLGVLQDYRNVRTVDDTLGSTKPSKRLPTAGKFDAINTLEVLDKDAVDVGVMSWMKGWENDSWKPYEHDQIAFFFYDIVNQKYIPFRATLKSINESGGANWEELSFVGRADKIYSYGGFTRTLAFNFSVVIGSLAELAPTWQRINYLTTLIKPANYTTSDYNGAMNRFMVSPMVMLTLGDMYKDQPILIRTIGTTIPEDASWETQNEDNMKDGWQHLSSYMTADKKVLYGQLPRTIDISLTMILLEKERALVGGANFGHAPRDNYWNFIPGTNTSPLHNSFVVEVIPPQQPQQFTDQELTGERQTLVGKI